MSARRGLLCLAALASAVVVAGCATTVAGNGSLAADVQAPTTDDATDTPTGSASETTTPPDSGGNDPKATGNKVCSLFTAEELRNLFGEPVTAKGDGGDRGCDFETAGNGGVMVNIYDYLNMKEESARDKGGKSLTVAGKPAYQGRREIMVARTSDPAAPGLIIASNLFFDDEAKGNRISLQLLEKIVPKFPK
jgi:hypothetical protein